MSQIVLPLTIKRQILTSLQKHSSESFFELRKAKVGIFPLMLTLSHFISKTGSPTTTQFQLNFNQIIAHLSIKDLLHGKIVFPLIEINNLQTNITEGDLSFHSSNKIDRGKILRSAIAHLRQVKIMDSGIIYHRVHSNQYATLHVNKITGIIEIKDKDIHSTVHGILEKSGSFEVNFLMPRTFSNLNLDINLKLSNQNLKDLNPYFAPAEGIHLSGTLHRGESVLKVRDDHLSGWVKAKYLNLNIDFKKTKNRSAASAFFKNLLKSIKIKENNIGILKKEQTRSVALTRFPEEAPLHFIFRGMSKAALQIPF